MMPFLFLMLVAGQFEVRGPNAGELARRAHIRCGGEATAVDVSDGGLSGTFACVSQSGADVTDVLTEAELVVSGKVTKVVTPPATLFDDPGPQWRRATVKVLRVLKGHPQPGTVSFIFIGSSTDGNEEAPKVKVGQSGVWLLTRGSGQVRELMMLSSFDSQPPEAEAYLKELLAEKPCPTSPRGTCPTEGAVCPGRGVLCSCESACGGGAPPPNDSVAPLGWVCRPTACSSAVAGGKCAPDGMACMGCWGQNTSVCEKGRWRFPRISPPP